MSASAPAVRRRARVGDLAAPVAATSALLFAASVVITGASSGGDTAVARTVLTIAAVVVLALAAVSSIVAALHHRGTHGGRAPRGLPAAATGTATGRPRRTDDRMPRPADPGRPALTSAALGFSAAMLAATPGPVTAWPRLVAVCALIAAAALWVGLGYAALARHLEHGGAAAGTGLGGPAQAGMPGIRPDPARAILVWALAGQSVVLAACATRVTGSAPAALAVLGIWGVGTAAVLVAAPAAMLRGLAAASSGTSGRPGPAPIGSRGTLTAALAASAASGIGLARMPLPSPVDSPLAPFLLTVGILCAAGAILGLVVHGAATLRRRVTGTPFRRPDALRTWNAALTLACAGAAASDLPAAAPAAGPWVPVVGAVLVGVGCVVWAAAAAAGLTATVRHGAAAAIRLDDDSPQLLRPPARHPHLQRPGTPPGDQLATHRSARSERHAGDEGPISG